MESPLRFWILVGMAALASCSRDAAAPDLILLGGKIITVDSTDRIAEALAVRGNRIVAVGTSNEIAALAGPSTRTVELGGRAVTPGLIDAHAHFASGGTSRIAVLDLGYPNVTSIADIKSKVAEQAARLAPEQWIQGRGWDEGALAERRGKYADLAVWDRDPYTVATDDLKEMRCLLTVFNGQIVHDSLP